jgi:hypothetical protein
LHGANLRRADLSGALFSRARLQGADLAGVRLHHRELDPPFSRGEMTDLTGLRRHFIRLLSARTMRIQELSRQIHFGLIRRISARGSLAPRPAIPRRESDPMWDRDLDLPCP